VKDILVTEDHRSVGIDSSRSNKTTRVLVIVVDWRGTNIVWNADGQFTAWVNITVKNISESISTLLTRVELLDQSSSSLRDPRLSDGLSRRDNNDCWLASVDDGLDKVRHSTNKVEVCNVDVLAGSSVQTLPEFVLIAGPSTNDHNRNICCFGCFDGIREATLIARPTFATLSEGNLCIVLE